MYFSKKGYGIALLTVLVALMLITYKGAADPVLEPVQEVPKTVAVEEVEEPAVETALAPALTLEEEMHLLREAARAYEVAKEEASKQAVYIASTLPKTNSESVSRGGSSHRVVKATLENCQVTWYNNEGISYTTKSGTRTVDGVTVAVDPKVIPLGTWIEIHMPDGTVYRRRAEDTGGAVKGHIVDIYADQPTKELLRRGRTHGATVYILGGE